MEFNVPKTTATVGVYPAVELSVRVVIGDQRIVQNLGFPILPNLSPSVQTTRTPWFVQSQILVADLIEVP